MDKNNLSFVVYAACGSTTDNCIKLAREALIKSFDKLRTNGKRLIPFVVSPSATLRRALSNHEGNQLVQCFPSLVCTEVVICICPFLMQLYVLSNP